MLGDGADAAGSLPSVLRQSSGITLPLFERFGRLAENVAWMPLGHWPTPITHARRFGNAHHLGGLFVKREDHSHPECGGNKIRGLEFLLAEARRRRVDTILSFGAAGSHHLCRTAWHARKLGIDTIALILKQPIADYVRQNMQTGLACGARYVPANLLTLLPHLAGQWVRARYSAPPRSVMYIPPGGTSPLSCLGHVNAALELKQQINAGQLPEPDYLYAAMGSLGTVAGLALGCKLAGLKTRIVGVIVSYRWYCTPGRWARLARRTLQLMRRLDPSVPAVRVDTSELSVVETALGRGYAHFTDSSMQLARQFRDHEGIQLDGTYTAKTLDGMLRFIHAQGRADDTHLFWNSYHEMPKTDPLEIESIPSALRGYCMIDGIERQT